MQWGVKRFVNQTPFQPYPSTLEQQLSSLNVFTPFILFDNGLVKLNTHFTDDMSGYFLVNVHVADYGGLSDEAQLRVSCCVICDFL